MPSYNKKPGNVRKTESGKYQARVTRGLKRDGMPRTMTGTFETEAEADAARMRFYALLGADPNAGDEMTLGEYYESFFVPDRSGRLTRATMNRYATEWKLRIEPMFGHRAMSSIKHVEIQNAVNCMTYHTARQFVATLRAIMRSAWDDGYLSDEPMRHRVRYPKKKTRQRGVWDAATVARALPVMEGVPIEALWLLMTGMGLRREEAYALYGRDLVFSHIAGIDGTEVCVCSAEIREAVTIEDGRKPTKTEFSERFAVMADPFASRLEALGITDDEPVCPVTLSHVGKVWDRLWEPREVSTDGNGKYYKGRMLAAGIPKVQMSRMRATHETIMQQQGIADTLNARIHGRSEKSGVGYTNYLNPQGETMVGAAVLMGAAVRDAG